MYLYLELAKFQSIDCLLTRKIGCFFCFVHANELIEKKQTKQQLKPTTYFKGKLIPSIVRWWSKEKQKKNSGSGFALRMCVFWKITEWKCSDPLCYSSLFCDALKAFRVGNLLSIICSLMFPRCFELRRHQQQNTNHICDAFRIGIERYRAANTTSNNRSLNAIRMKFATV